MRTSLSRAFYKHRFGLVALLVACVAAWPLWREAGLLNTRGGGDSPFLLQRVQQLATALRGGHFPVRWMPDANYGAGYPFFNYYAPLSIYIPAGLSLLGFPYVVAIKLAQLLGFLLAGGGMYRLVTDWLGDEWAGLLASVAYTLAPFHLVNVYVRGDSLAEFWAMALYPVVLWTVARPGKQAIIWLGVSYAALTLSHNISALIFSPFLLLYVFFRAWQPQQRRFEREVWLKSVWGIGLGLALSAWFWLPALAETGLVQTEPVTTGYFHYSNHFLDADLVQPSFFFDYDVAGGRAFRMGLIQAGLIIAGLVTLLKTRRTLRTTHYALATTLIATFMLLSWSSVLWERLPLLPFTQFPWRFLSVQAFGGAILVGGLGVLGWRRVVVPAGVLLLLISTLGQLKPDHLPLADIDITPERIAQYEWFTGNIGTTVSAEYLPQTVQPRPYTSAWLAAGERGRAQVVGQATAELLERQAVAQTWRVVAERESVVVFPTLNWPGWVAEVGGERVDITAAEGTGLIAWVAPAGNHTITLKLTRTPVRLVAEWVSLLVGLGVLVSVRQADFRRARWGVWGLLGVVLVAQLWPEPTYSPDTLTWDFAQMGYLHHSPAGILFSDDNRLLGYDYSAETAQGGEVWQIDLQWDEPLVAQSVTVALGTPAGTRFPHAPDFVGQTQPLAERMTFVFELPVGVPAGLVVPRLELADAYALTPTGEQRGALYLRPVRIGARGGEQAAERLQVRVEEVGVVGDVGLVPAGGVPDYAFGCGEAVGGTLQTRLSWLTHAPILPNYQLSLRLSDGTGLALAQCDQQTGYGFAPTSLWPMGEWVNDWVSLPLPAQLPTVEPLALTVRLYGAETGETVFVRRLGALVWQAGGWAFVENEPLFVVPAGLTPAAVRFGEGLVLHGYGVGQPAGRVGVTLAWGALAAGQADVVRFVHLLDPATGEIVLQVDGVPQAGSYPMSQWTTGEVVVEEVVVDVSGVPAGAYQLAIGLYHPQEPFPRLPASDSQNQPLPDNRLLISLTIP